MYIPTLRVVSDKLNYGYNELNLSTHKCSQNMSISSLSLILEFVKSCDRLKIPTYLQNELKVK